jgi:PIN domain nuclease of toxin-antitoxin system
VSDYLVDTHVLIWLADGNPRIKRKSRALLDGALASDRLYVSAVSIWETVLLMRRGRISVRDPAGWRETVLSSGFTEVALDGAIAIAAAELAGFHADPADRFIVATAISRDAVLVTADEKILGWKGTLRSLDPTE